jgi:tetratricopeptide (TPR) repeat protein
MDCDLLTQTGQSEAARACYLDLLNNDDPAVHAEAFWRLGDRKTANRSFRRATEEQPDNAHVRARWGLFFVDIHQPADAEKLFYEALDLDPDQIDALLGLANLLTGRFDAKASELISRVLDLHPDHPQAQALVAATHLQTGDTQAASDLLLPLADNDMNLAQRLEIFAVLAAVDHLDGTLDDDGVSAWSKRAIRINPGYGDAFATPAYYFVITRRYREAIALLEKATAVQPDHWRAHADLGTNLLRLNRFSQAREHLITAYDGDPYNAEVVNTLRLLDSLDETFDTIVTDELVLRVHADEADALAPYVRQLVSQAGDARTGMASRYNLQLTRPVVIELYQHHDDFAVRTAGLPGIGILGAAFGDVVVMDGPSAQPPEQFDWSSALWHELAHVYTLNATDNLVSRWFSEGVSVYEERRFGPSQNSSAPLHFLDAVADDRLLGVSNLDEGFIRPRYPEQIAVSYVQAGLLCVYIGEQYPQGLQNILAAYASGASTQSAITQGLGISTTDLDVAFKAYLDATYGTVIPHLDEFKSLLADGATALDDENWNKATTIAAAAIEMYPAYVGPDSPYLIAAKGFEKIGPPHKVIDALQRYWQAGGRQPAALDHLARSLHESASYRLAAQVQKDLVRTSPLVAEHHQTYADWLFALGDFNEALAEYRVVQALKPHDLAASYYNVASTLYRLGRYDQARQQLLYALEIAPRFSDALKLLTEISQ